MIQSQNAHAGILNQRRLKPSPLSSRILLNGATNFSMGNSRNCDCRQQQRGSGLVVMKAQREFFGGMTRLKHFSKYGLMLAALLGLGWLATGCSTTEMKGTPFYTGEYSQRQGPAEERINLWPVFYYREPAMSALWPVFELTEDHAAVRPLFSVYGLDRPQQQYNVLWPLAQLDRRTGHNRIFPLFWGDNYRVVFPFYWHGGEPWGARGGYDSLFPLWVLQRREPDYFNLYCPWPLARVWSDDKKQFHGSMVLPLYWHQRDEQASRIFSLPWWSESSDNGDFWRLLLPVFYQMQAGENSAFISPLWSQGESAQGDWRAMFPLWYYQANDAGAFDWSSPWPLVRWWRDPETDSGGSAILPLYWYQREAQATRFYSLPWSSSSDPDGFWRLLPPLFFQSANAQREMLVTPLWAQGRKDTTDWNLLLPLWFYSHEATNRSSLYLPLAHFWSDRRLDERGSTVLPFYWHQQRNGHSRFYSALWMSETDQNGDFWRLLPPLFYQDSVAGSSKLITPLWAQGKSADRDWAALIPFCYWDRQQHELYSPLWAHWHRADTETWLAPWTLSWLTQTPERTDLTLLGGLARSSWGHKPQADYILPLYYYDAERGTELSPLWLSWRNKETQTTVVPGLLSWQTRAPDRTDLWLAAGLARASWGDNPGGDYLFPIFYHDDESLFTPLFGWNHEVGYSYYATPLLGAYTGKLRGSWCFPFYHYSRNASTDEATANYLLLGNYRKTKEQTRSSLIPFYSYQNRHLPEQDPADQRRRQTYGQSFWCLPFCWSRDQVHLRPPPGSRAQQDSVVRENDTHAEVSPGETTARTNALMIRDYVQSHGVFPLWSSAQQSTPAEARTNRNTSVLLWLYDYQHSSGPLPGGATNDYVRSRVFWRLWHYEKVNETVSVDVFPGFTYDHKPDGFRKISFLWRGFRHEVDAAGRRKLDVLFIPLRRSPPTPD
jgi:hypothetical protein